MAKAPSRTTASEMVTSALQGDDGKLSIDERVDRLERLTAQYFGTHHFEPPAPAFDPETARQSARDRFQREMEAIEQQAGRQPAATEPQPADM